MEILFDSEKVVIAALLNDPKLASEIIPKIKEEDFEDLVCKVVYSKIVECNRRDLGIDVSTICSMAQAELPGVASFLANMMTAPTTMNLTMFVDEIREKSKDKKLRKVGLEMAERGLGVAHTDYVKKLDEVYVSHSREGLFNFSQSMEAVLAFLEKQHLGGETGINTGIKEFDRVIHGYQRGHLHILAARPGMGKTAFALNNFLHAVISGHKAIFFSIEQTLVDIKKRMISCAGALQYQYLNESPLKEAVEIGVLRTIERLKKFDESYMIDVNKVSVDDVFNTALMAKSKLGSLDIIFVDYLQIMKPVTKYDSREREVSEISDGLKEIAKRLDVAVVALAQLNRDVAKRLEKRPQLCDLRDSGSIEQDADLVCFLHRDGYYNPKSDPRDCDLVIAKNRHGECRDIKIKFHFEYMRFGD